MEQSLSYFVLKLTKKLNEYAMNRKEIAESYDYNSPEYQHFISESVAFQQTMDIVAETVVGDQR